MKLDNVRLLVSNFDACLHFYQTVLGLKRIWGEPGGDYASFEAEDGKVLALFRKEQTAETLGTESLLSQTNAQDRFACIFEVTDLKQTVQEMKELGGTFISDIQHMSLWGISTAHLRDPDGNLIEIITKLPEEDWDSTLVEQNNR